MSRTGMLKNSVKINYFYDVIYKLSNVLFPLVTFPYISRILAPEGVGTVQFGISLAQSFAVISALGIPVYGIKEVAKCQHDKQKLSLLFTELISLHAVMVVLLSIIYLAATFYFPDLYAIKEVLLICSLIVFSSLFNIDWFYSGLEKFKFIALRSLSVKVVSIALIFLLVKTREDIAMYAWILTFGFVGNYLLNLVGLEKKVRLITELKILNVKKHLQHLFFIFGTILIASLYSYSDSAILGLLSTKYEVGIYVVAVKLSKISIPIIIAMSTVMIPQVSVLIEQKKSDELNQAFRDGFGFVILMAIPICFGLFALREEFILIFSGEEFLSSVEVLAYLTPLPLFIGFGYFFAFLVLIPLDRNPQVFIAAIIGLVSFLAINLLLTPNYGAKGTAIATFITEGLVTVIYVAFTPNYIVKKLPWKRVAYSSLICFTFFPIVQGLRLINDHLFFVTLTAVPICALVYFSCQLFIFKDGSIRKLLQSKRTNHE
ncbi:MAG: flippase [Cytophagales bacterium]|nr:flippase [Cytophagales bacterium]